MPAERLVLFQWGVSSYFGWGIYGLNLLLAWAERTDLKAASLQRIEATQIDVDPLEQRLLAPALARSAQLQDALRNLAGQRVSSPHLVMHTLNNGMERGRAGHHVDLLGSPQVAVAFLDRTDVSPGAAAALREYEFVVAGSSWNRELLLQAGAPHVELLLQGVDLSHFHPAPRRGLFPGRFVVFSGGKLEYRKGQDLVIRAFQRFSERHDDALLLTAWSSPWPEQARSLAADPTMRPPPFRDDGRVDVTAWAGLNGIDATRVIDLGAVPNRAMPRILREADVGLFPNRAEGGTNLVAMECMACGVPTILSANTGHLDLIADGVCLPLRSQAGVPGAAFRGWGTSCIDEMVEALETVYADTSRARALGAGAAAAMAGLSWARQMDLLADLLTNIA